LLEALAPGELHSCHWPARRGEEVAAFLEQTRGYVERLDVLVRSCLAEPLTLRGLIRSCNERLPEPWPPGLDQELVYSVHGHVRRLVERGVATETTNGENHAVFRAGA
jgi:hypothetical protein